MPSSPNHTPLTKKKFGIEHQKSKRGAKTCIEKKEKKLLQLFFAINNVFKYKEDQMWFKSTVHEVVIRVRGLNKVQKSFVIFCLQAFQNKNIKQ